MGWFRVAVGALGTLLMMGGVMALYLGFSALVLWVAGRLLPLARRGRRKD